LQGLLTTLGWYKDALEKAKLYEQEEEDDDEDGDSDLGEDDDADAGDDDDVEDVDDHEAFERMARRDERAALEDDDDDDDGLEALYDHMMDEEVEVESPLDHVDPFVQLTELLQAMQQQLPQRAQVRRIWLCMMYIDGLFPHGHECYDDDDDGDYSLTVLTLRGRGEENYIEHWVLRLLFHERRC